MLTYYDFIHKEWFLQSQATTDRPIARSGAFNLIKDNDLYLIGGGAKTNENLNSGSVPADAFVRRLDLKTFQWEKGNKYEGSYFEKIKPINSCIQIGEKLVLIASDIKEIDLFNNTVKIYKNRSPKGLKKLIYHKKNKYVSYVYDDSNHILKVISEPYTNLKGELLDETPFYVPTVTTTAVVLVSFLVGSLCLLFFIILYHKKRKKRTHSLVYNTKKNIFYVNKSRPLVLTEQPFKVLKLFLEHQNTFIPLRLINDVISNDLDDENYITINKRRERVLKELTVELAACLQRDKNTIVETRSSEADKRIKEVKLNIEFRIK